MTTEQPIRINLRKNYLILTFVSLKSELCKFCCCIIFLDHNKYQILIIYLVGLLPPVDRYYVSVSFKVDWNLLFQLVRWILSHELDDCLVIKLGMSHDVNNRVQNFLMSERWFRNSSLRNTNYNFRVGFEQVKFFFKCLLLYPMLFLYLAFIIAEIKYHSRDCNSWFPCSKSWKIIGYFEKLYSFVFHLLKSWCDRISNVCKMIEVKTRHC